MSKPTGAICWSACLSVAPPVSRISGSPTSRGFSRADRAAFWMLCAEQCRMLRQLGMAFNMVSSTPALDGSITCASAPV